MSDAAVSAAASSRARGGRGRGLPNYFDDQRFGSVGETPEFVAREMVFGRFEDALKLALAAPYEFDRAGREAREGDAPRDTGATGRRVKAKLPQGHARSLVDYLVTHPTDFKGRSRGCGPELQGLYLSAYQSYLWNRMLAAWLRAHASRPTTLPTVELKLGRVPVPVRVPDEKQCGVGIADAAAAVGPA